MPNNGPAEATALVLGVDPGSRALGWALVRPGVGQPTRVDSGVLRPPAGKLADRLGFLLQKLSAIFEQHPITALAIESAFVQTNPRTALVLGQARGLPIALAASRGLPVHEYAPAQVKRQVVGRGRATKGQVQHMVAAQLHLSELPQEDEADALAIALTHVRADGTASSGAARPKTPAQIQYENALKAAGGRRRKR